jgi:Fur family ferric uptake transcriptional regulator
MGAVAVPLPAIEVAQTPEERFREFLASRPKPQRYTEQQREMVRHIFAKHQHFDTDELLAELQRANRRVSRATVYRTLTKLVDAGLLRRIEIGPRTVYDHDYGYPWHEHLVCGKCKKMIEFTDAGISAAVKAVAAAHRFQMDGYDLVVNGTCAECNAAAAAKRRHVM